MEDLLELPPFLQPYAPILVAAVALCSAIASVTPPSHSNKVVNFLLKLVNFMALNFGKAKRVEDGKQPPTSAG
jgi:hypothetical protein